MAVPSDIWLYRITHIDNLEHILREGCLTVHSKKRSKNYRQIGDKSMIDYRKDLDAPNPPGGKFSEFIPFYLGPRSPMLYQIATGWEDIEQVDQREIIYIISSFEMVKEHDLEFFFTDGHARSRTSKPFINEGDFKKLDWEAIYARRWNNEANDLRRKDRKQSEFLVKDHLPVSCIVRIGVYSVSVKRKVLDLLESIGLEIDVNVDPRELYYDHL